MLCAVRRSVVTQLGRRPGLTHLACSSTSHPPPPPDCWPDGTPKKFKGREAWKNWIDWESPHRLGLGLGLGMGLGLGLELRSARTG